MKPKLIAFLNSYTEGISGGDIRFVEIAKRLNDFKKIVVTSLLGKRFCQRKELHAKYIITTREMYASNIMQTYFQRIIRAVFMKNKIEPCDILYSTSDFLPDVLPAFWYKLTSRKVKWVSAIYLIMPSLFRNFSDLFARDKFTFPSARRALYYFSQKISVFLMKNFSDAILVLNARDKEYLVKKHRIDKWKVFVVNMGVDNEEIREIKVERKNYDGAFIGRFHPQKGVFDLIKIWKIVCLKKPETKLALIGSGSREFTRKVISEIEKEGLSMNIDLLGFKNGKDKFYILKSSKVLLFPSMYESWGAVAVEAMASGLPVIAYDLPIFKDIFPKGMIKVPIGDTKKFANQTLSLLSDQQLYEKISREAMDNALKYDWYTVVEAELEIFRCLLDNNRRVLDSK